MNLDPKCILTYSISLESWYASVSHKGEKPSIMIGSNIPDDGCDWEFKVVEYDLNGPTVHLEMFGDSFKALGEVPEFFEALRVEVPTTLDDVRAILDRLGATDATSRLSPYGKTTPEQEAAARMRSEADDLWRRADQMDPPASTRATSTVDDAADLMAHHFMKPDQSCTCGWAGTVGDRFTDHIAALLGRRGLLADPSRAELP